MKVMQDLEVSTKNCIYLRHFLVFYLLLKVYKVFAPYFLQKKLLEAKALNENMIVEKNKYSQQLEEEKKISLQNDAKVGSGFVFLAPCFIGFEHF